MTQLNLLPDVKLQYLKSTRNKRLVMGVSALVIVVSIAVILLLVSIAYIFQKKNIKALNSDITTYNTQLKNTADLDKVLTVQNQLASLTKLHEDKAVAPRLFEYVKQVTPAATSISQLDIDFTANTLSITGSAPSLDVANTFIDTLKFTTYQKTSPDGQASTDSPKAFSGVVLSQFARNNTGATYNITLSYNKDIFDSASAIKLTVPKIISTRSLTEQPTDLFQSAPKGNQ